MKKPIHGLAIVLAVAASSPGSPALAKDYSGLDDLVGMRASSAERELNDRGYRYREGHQGDRYRHAYWWNSKHDRCVDVKTRDGRVRAVEKTDAKDCGKSGGSGAGTAVAVVAGAALIAALATAGSHKKSEDKAATAKDANGGGTVTVNDLNGWRASSADSELSNRGFTNVDAFQSGSTSYTIWYRRESGQCVQMTTAEGKATDVRDIGTHEKCK